MEDEKPCEAFLIRKSSLLPALGDDPILFLSDRKFKRMQVVLVNSLIL